MTIKLTLSVNEEVVKNAKRISKTQGQSLSKMVENFFRQLEAKATADREPGNIHPEVRKLRGIARINDKSNYEDMIAGEILQKHS